MCDSLAKAKAGRRHARRGALGVVTPSGRIYSAAMVRLTRGAEAHLALLGYGDHLVQVTAARTAALRDRPGLSVSTSPVAVDAELSGGDGSLQLLLLIVLFG